MGSEMCIRDRIRTVQQLITVRNQASWFSSFSNLTSTIIGAGILGLPYAFSQFGWILGLISLSLTGLSSAFSLILLSLCAKQVGKPASFHTVAEMTIPKLSFLIDGAVAIKCWGVATSYIIIIGDLMPVFCIQTECNSIFHQRNVWITIAFFIISPLCCFHSMDALKYTSSLSIIGILLVVILVILYSIPNNGSIPNLNPCPTPDLCGEVKALNLGLHSLKVFPIFVFGFTCQQNIFTIVNEMALPTPGRINSVITASIGSSYIIYIIIAICGFITFGDKVASDLLINFPLNAVSSFARVCISLVVLLHYPLQLNPARKCILSILKNVDNEDELQPNIYFRKYCFVTLTFLLSSFGVALSTNDLGIMMSLVGATGSTMVSYILPGAFYYYLHRRDNTIKKKLALIMLITGIIIIPLCCYAQFI